jgi:hypothetical protein
MAGESRNVSPKAMDEHSEMEGRIGNKGLFVSQVYQKLGNFTKRESYFTIRQE